MCISWCANYMISDLYFVCTRASTDVMLARTCRLHFMFAMFYFKMARSLKSPPQYLAELRCTKQWV